MTKRRRRVVRALGFLAVLTTLGGVAVEHLGASALIHAPNAGRPPDDIAPSHSEALHARAQGHSELVLVDGEDHLGILADRSGTVWRHAGAWLSRWLDPR